MLPDYSAFVAYSILLIQELQYERKKNITSVFADIKNVSHANKILAVEDYCFH
jgi:hypothetical protein